MSEIRKPMTFVDAPLNEVVLGRTFKTRPDILIPHFGAFWTSIRSRFPKVQHADPILQPSDAVFDLPLPRIWLISGNSSQMVQLQQDRMHFNWRLTDKGSPYVRFPSVQAGFVEMWDLFDAFVQETTGQGLQPSGAELTYVNLIRMDGGDAASILRETFVGKPSEVPGLQTMQPEAFNYINDYRLSSGSKLKASVASARATGINEHLIKFELTVSGTCSVDESFELWSSKAHDDLIAAFRAMTRPEAHSRWKLEESNVA